MNSTQLQAHWNSAYQGKPIDQLGWHEAQPEPSLSMLSALNLNHKKVFLPGIGASLLVDHLLESSAELYVNDISSKALEVLHQRVGAQPQVHYVPGDLRDPTLFEELPTMDIWHDRAVFHFLTAHQDRLAYLQHAHQALHKDGELHVATFHLSGAEKCSGLPVERYDTDKLKSVFAPWFQLIKAGEYAFYNPAGAKRPYIYATFQKH